MVDHEHDLSWLVERFDRIDRDNDDIKHDNKAIQKDLKLVSEKVIQHGVYWDVVKWLAVSGSGLAAALAGFFGFHHKP